MFCNDVGLGLGITWQQLSRGNDLVTRGFELPNPGYDLLSRGHELVSHSHELLSRGHELLTLIFFTSCPFTGSVNLFTRWCYYGFFFLILALFTLWVPFC